jgi:hypothetical protein
VKDFPRKKLKDQKTLDSCESKGNKLFSDSIGFLTIARRGLKEANALLCLVYNKV